MTLPSSWLSKRLIWVAIALVGVVGAGALATAASPKFYSDDPLQREPEAEDASKVASWDIILTYDLLQNLFRTPGEIKNQRALNVNTIDEVPDSNWFTNRVLARPLSDDELVRGPQNGPGPARGRLTIVRTKPAGVTPGFVARDSAGVTWFVQFDAPDYNEAASGAAMVANKIFHALGYWQTENYLAEIRSEDIVIGDGVRMKLTGGRTRAFRRSDVDAVLARAAKQPNGTYRILASRGVSGRPVGGFRYEGTRPDDPNDVVPHEHRRELRALQVFGGWTNLVDLKAGNTLDVVIPDGNRSVIRHYLQDVGSTFGTGALAPHKYEEGHEYLIELDTVRRRLVSLGFFISPWQRTPYEELPAIGRFEGDRFDPVAWKPHSPTAAILNARADDQFWAARRVMAFSDAMIRTMVKTGGYSDPNAERLLGDVLIKRRDRIGRTFLTAINPIVSPALAADGRLTFENAAVKARVAGEAKEYRATWFAFDNATGESRRIGEAVSATDSIAAPSMPPPTPGQYLRVDIAAVSAEHTSWNTPVRAYFKRGANAWALVGLERME